MTLREEHRLSTLEKRVLRIIFGPNRDVTEAWKKLHNEELHDAYSFSNIIRMTTSKHMNGEKRNAYRIMVGKPEVKRPLRRPRCRWVDNIKIDLRERGRGCNGTNWIYLAQDMGQWRTVLNTEMSLRVAQNAGKFLSSCTTGSFSRRAQLHEDSIGILVTAANLLKESPPFMETEIHHC
jgi:hypothetical protein